MHHAGSMRRLDGLRDLSTEPQHLIRRQGTPPQPVLERLALQVLHHQVVDPIL